jgi:hypothetical protein
MTVHVSGNWNFRLSYGTRICHEAQFLSSAVQTYYNVQNLYDVDNKNLIPVWRGVLQTIDWKSWMYGMGILPDT